MPLMHKKSLTGNELLRKLGFPAEVTEEQIIRVLENPTTRIKSEFNCLECLDEAIEKLQKRLTLAQQTLQCKNTW